MVCTVLLTNAKVLKTVVNVLLIFSLFIAGFAFSFYVLLQQRFHFGTPGRSLMKTFVMMTGEFEYSDYFQPVSCRHFLTSSRLQRTNSEQGELRFIGLSYLVFIIFVAVMPIILMNLLVGGGFVHEFTV